MSRELVDKLVNAVLYEGYILYPYRMDATKNRQRFTFGRVYPHAFSQAHGGAESYTMQTQCLLEVPVQPDPPVEPVVNVSLRFLHPLSRIIGAVGHEHAKRLIGFEGQFQPVPELRVGRRLYQSWQEAVEQELQVSGFAPKELLTQPRRIAFRFEAARHTEPIRDDQGHEVGMIMRQQHALIGMLEVSATQVEDGLYTITVRVENQTPLEDAELIASTEDEAVMMRTFVSSHLILTAQGGQFVSLIDPPERCACAAAACQNQGVFPVLVGDPACARDTLLASPIILYDYPEVAPQSPGDLFDSTEIDEILTLRIMTMTDDEKWQMSQVDERARQILQRTESMDQDHLMKMHGTLREIHPLPPSDEQKP